MKTNETLADILAEMRDTCGDIADHEVVDYADRIEAAAKREIRDAAMEHAVLPAVCISRGNAAAMREALKEISELVWSSIDPECDNDCCRPLRRIARIADAALAAPPRNCDRFATVGAAHKAWRATDQERDFVDWLFDPAESSNKQEGGAK